MNTPVNFEIAKLLKEKGFDEECNSYYSQALFEGTNPDWEGVFPKYSIFKRSDYHYNSKPNFNDLWFECSAPTITEVVCWIYSKYQIWIQVSILKDNEWHYSIRRKDNNWDIEFPTKEKYTSIENAYEKGINVVLNTYKPKS